MRGKKGASLKSDCVCTPCPCVRCPKSSIPRQNFTALAVNEHNSLLADAIDAVGTMTDAIDDVSTMANAIDDVGAIQSPLSGHDLSFFSTEAPTGHSTAQPLPLGCSYF
jgi:hypothetical protein